MANSHVSVAIFQYNCSPAPEDSLEGIPLCAIKTFVVSGTSEYKKSNTRNSKINMHFFPMNIPRMYYLVLLNGVCHSGFPGENFIFQNMPEREKRISPGRKKHHRKRILKHKHQNSKKLLCLYECDYRTKKPPPGLQ